MAHLFLGGWHYGREEDVHTNSEEDLISQKYDNSPDKQGRRDPSGLKNRCRYCRTLVMCQRSGLLRKLIMAE